MRKGGRRVPPMATEGGDRKGEAKPPLPADIEDLHAEVVARGEETYTDPETGYMVFTELFHKKRGYCCGNRCRHCPYDWVHVGDPKAVRAAAAAAKEREQNGAEAAVADGASSDLPAPPAQRATDAASSSTGCLTMGGGSALVLGRKRNGGLGIATAGPARRTLMTTRSADAMARAHGPLLQMVKGCGRVRPGAVKLVAVGAASLLLGAFGGSG